MRHWSQWRSVAARHLPAEMRSWLLDQGSLTQRLETLCEGPMRVAVLQSRWQRPWVEEARALALPPEQRVLCREVLLCDADQPLVYARTLIPAQTVQRAAHCLLRLGAQPLGALLFRDPQVRRGPIDVAHLFPSQRLFIRTQQVAAYVREPLWARRSCFWMAGQPLWVSEIFLPSLWRHAHGS